MSLVQLEKRVTELEQTVNKLVSEMSRTANGHGRWWVDAAGRFANDPLFDEIVRLGREYRESLRPRKTKRKA